MQERESFDPKEETGRDGAAAGEEATFGLSRFLESMAYPVSKEDIIDYATDQGAETAVLEMLEQLPDTIYNSPADVSQALGENSNLVT